MNQENRDKNKIRRLIEQLIPFTLDQDRNIKRHAIGLKKSLERILNEEKEIEEGDIKIINGIKYKRID